MTTTIEQQIANLSPEKRALLAAHLEKRGQTNSSQSYQITRRNPTQALPLSFAQQRLWFLHQVEPDSVAYNNITVLRLTGILHIAALQQSLNELVRRHESLRTTFTMVGEEPQQVINPPVAVPLPMEDLSNLSVAQREVTIESYALSECRILFDLTHDLMRRTKLLRFGDQEHVLLLTSHHIASDGWSNTVFWHELSALYAAFVQGQPSPLPDLPIQYADYALWQRQRLQGERLATLLDYWQAQLADIPELLALPTDFTRPAQQAATGATWRFTIAKPLTEALKSLARQHEATLFMTLLAAFQVLLARYSGQTDIVVGTPIAGRQHAALEGLIGMFVNTLVMRTKLDGNPSFRTLLQQVRSMALAAYTHQDLPFERLVEALQPKRTLRYHPIVQVMFGLQNMPEAQIDLQEVTVQQLPIGSETAKHDLSFSLAEVAYGLDARLEYDTALFAPATIERYARHFITLLTAIVANPDCPVGQLPLLSAQEQQQILVAWNQTQASYPRDRTLHQQFEEQVERTPDAVALVLTNANWREQALTYRQLNMRANQLAHYLQTVGVGPEKLVALCIERSVEMIVAVLGILKAGAAYLPIDPTTPRERIGFLLQDAQAKILCTQATLLDQLPTSAIPVLCLDRDWWTIAQQPNKNVVNLVSSHHLAYVLYTSGSTGQPKGVMVEHQQVVNYVYSMLATCVPPASSCAMLQPLTVDSCLTMLFPPLLSGGTLHLLSSEQALDARALVKYFQQHTIDCLKIAPSHLAALQEGVSPNQLMPKRSLIIGGEASRWEWVQELQTLSPTCQVWNHYGPTETTVGVFIFPTFLTDAQASFQNTPIGRPIANTQAYLLDHQQQPVPIGVVGELYIAGENVARGYLNQPGFTNERFIDQNALYQTMAVSCHEETLRLMADTFFTGKRNVYRTGDLGRYRPDGTVEFLGRNDDQVKIRGFRIELAEIEQTLLRHPIVREAVVLARADHTHEKHLVAYVILKENKTSTIHSQSIAILQNFLKANLPSQMIPSAIIIVAQWPHTPHGKVDRQALAGYPFVPTREQDYRPPVTPLQRQLANLWTSLLQVEEIGIHDDFFQVGGHSLLVIRLLVQIEQQFQQSLPLRDFIFNPTIAHLATLLGDPQSVAADRLQTDSQQVIQSTSSSMDTDEGVLLRLYNTLPAQTQIRQLRQTLHVKRPHSRWLVTLLRLPQPIAMQFLAWTVQQPWVQRRYLPKQTALVQRFLAGLETVPVQRDHVARCLFFGFLPRFGLRNAIFQRIRTEGRTIPVERLEMLTHARAKGQPVILLNSHNYQAPYFRSLKLTESGIGSMEELIQQTKLEPVTARHILYTQQLDLARQTLQQGGVISIAPDVNRGYSTQIAVGFHGRMHQFRTSFAELALLTDAQLFFVASDLQAYNRFSFRLIGPFDQGSATMSHAERVQHLMDQYIDQLRQQWARNPWALPWWLMGEHLAYPPVEE